MIQPTNSEKEAIVKKHGWKKVKGFKIEHEYLNKIDETSYFSDDDFGNVVIPITFWKHETNKIIEDIDGVLLSLDEDNR